MQLINFLIDGFLADDFWQNNIRYALLNPLTYPNFLRALFLSHQVSVRARALEIL